MKKKSLCKKMIVAATVLMTAFSIYGCGASKEREVAIIYKEPYEKVTSSSTTVMKGDLTVTLNLKLKTDAVTNTNYTVNYEDLKVKSINVSVGDKVTKGQVLVSFKSEEIEKNIKEITERISNNKLLLQHIKNLMAIDKETDYKEDIKNLEEDIRIDSIYLEDENKKLNSYNIIAEEDGTVTYISDNLIHDFVYPKLNLITTISNDRKYVATTTDSYAFKIGDIYSIDMEMATYEFEVIDIVEEENPSGGVTKIITFKPLADMSAFAESLILDMEIDKGEIKDAVYVDRKAIILGQNNDYYVFVLDENGYKNGVKVEIGDEIDDYIVIRSGLNGGEEVTIE